MRIVTSLLALAGIAAAAVGAAAPKAAPLMAPVAPESVLRWKLKIAPDTSSVRNPAGRLSIQPKRGGRRQVYWYLVYNSVGEEGMDTGQSLFTKLTFTFR